MEYDVDFVAIVSSIKECGHVVRDVAVKGDHDQ
jgi:hypothetical protein